MSETTQQQPTDITHELETLRRTNGELIAKNATRKAQIAKLEATITALQSKLTETDASLRKLTVEVPLRQVAEQSSTAPDLFIQELMKSYKVESVDGKLALQTLEGKAVMVDGKPVPFEHQAMLQFLTDEANPQAQVFRVIMVGSRASGGASATSRAVASVIRPKPAHRFGLR